MKSLALLSFIILTTTTAATAQSQMVLRAQTLGRPNTSPQLGVDSIVHTHAPGRNSVITPVLYGPLPTGTYQVGYPANGIYADDSGAEYTIKPNGTTLRSVYTKKYNAAGLITEMDAYQPNSMGAPIPLLNIRNTYTSSMLPDTIMVRKGGYDNNRRVHAYNGNQLVAIHIQDWDLQSNSGTDSFFAGGVGSDSVVKHYNTAPALTGYARYIRDTANRILIDSQFTGNNFETARSFVYDTLGRVTVDSVVYPGFQQSFSYNRHTYKYDPVSGNMLSISSDIDWSTVLPYFKFHDLDSFTYNSDQQVTSMMNYSVGTSLTLVRAERFYYAFPANVPEIQQNNTLQLYPIPATSYIHLNMRFTKPQAFGVRIFDMQGRLVSNRQEAAQKQYNKQIPLTNMAPGQYTLHILAGDESVSRQFMVVR